jgi:hypothetical protein
MSSLNRGVPVAPAGTIFALGPDGGYKVPPREFTLYFGRNAENVHITIGARDPHVSRVHGMLTCGGSRDWWLRNHGTLPIQFPDSTLLLAGQDAPVPHGYTQLLIGTPLHPGAPGPAPHMLELYLAAGPATVGPPAESDDTTSEPIKYRLSERERLVVVALAQRYLRQEPHPQPVSWKQVAYDLNRAAPGEEWSGKAAAHLVASVRERIAAGPRPVAPLLREDGIGDPVGNALNHNLIQALLKSATLQPCDLRLLNELEH